MIFLIFRFFFGCISSGVLWMFLGAFSSAFFLGFHHIQLKILLNSQIFGWEILHKNPEEVKFRKISGIG